MSNTTLFSNRNRNNRIIIFRGSVHSFINNVNTNLTRNGTRLNRLRNKNVISTITNRNCCLTHPLRHLRRLRFINKTSAHGSVRPLTRDLNLVKHGLTRINNLWRHWHLTLARIRNFAGDHYNQSLVPHSRRHLGTDLIGANSSLFRTKTGKINRNSWS